MPVHVSKLGIPCRIQAKLRYLNFLLQLQFCVHVVIVDIRVAHLDKIGLHSTVIDQLRLAWCNAFERYQWLDLWVGRKVGGSIIIFRLVESLFMDIGAHHLEEWLAWWTLLHVQIADMLEAYLCRVTSSDYFHVILSRDKTIGTVIDLSLLKREVFLVPITLSVILEVSSTILLKFIFVD